MFCSQCGADHPEDSQFCRKCGRSLAVTPEGVAAVAPTRSKTPKSLTYRLGRFIGLRIPLLLLILVVAWYFMRINYGSKTTNQLVATVVHSPITLKDEIQNLRANSWKAIPLNLPYSGNVNVSLEVVRGNPVDIFLAGADQSETINQEHWSDVKIYADFTAVKTKSYQRDEQLTQGGYYLVMRDTSLGILSASASDISMKVRLSP